MDERETFSLPPDFLFGVSNAAYRVEGGYDRAGGPCNNWAEWEREGKVEGLGRSPMSRGRDTTGDENAGRYFQVMPATSGTGTSSMWTWLLPWGSRPPAMPPKT